jgi:hypothetical protein
MSCVRFDESITILVIFIKIKPHKKLLGHNSLNDASYQNPGMMLNGQGLGRHPLGDVSYLDLDTVLNEQKLCRRILSDALQRRTGVVKNEQEYSHLTQRMRSVSKLAESNMLRVCT